MSPLTLPSTEALSEVVFANERLWPLLLLVPVVVLAQVYALMQRRRALRSLGRPDLVARLVASVHSGRRLLQAIMLTLAVGLVALGLMRLQFGGTAEIMPSSGLDIVLAVDYSKSMLAKDVYPSRSERVEAELQRFIDEADRRGDRVGLVIFAGAARGLPVTRDARILKLYLQHADPVTENPGGTAIGKALKLALQFLVDARSLGDADEDEQAAREHDQIVVLLTDGEDNASRPQELAAEAARLGVRIFTVGIGSKSGEPIPKFDAQGNPDGFVTDEQGNYVMARVDEALLKQLAETTGGKHVLVEPDRFGLDEVRETLSKVAVSRQRQSIRIHRREGVRFLIVPAVVLLCFAMALGDRRRMT